MATRQTLSVRTRTVFGKKNADLRTSGVIPGVIYGQGAEAVSVSVTRSVFEKLFTAAGESTLIDLVIDEQSPTVALIHDVQRDPLRGELAHFDLYRVNMNKAITVTVPLVLVGEAPVVKSQGAVLVRAIDHVSVSCLPADLIHELTIDLGGLTAIDDAIRIGTIVPPSGVTIEGDPEAVVVTVQAPRAEEVVVAAPEADVTKVEVEKKGKQETDTAEAAKS
ncbi:MAG: 50S ribosomal protein L25 [Patescibacteria group bacterium]|jgi:large subunit ribosomal protein L25